MIEERNVRINQELGFEGWHASTAENEGPRRNAQRGEKDLSGSVCEARQV